MVKGSPTFRFRALGSIELLNPDGSAVLSVLAQPKRLALLAYLALATPRGFQRRDTLLALFWPELDESRARNALSQALHHLRRSLGARLLQNRGDEEVGLAHDELECDVTAFREAVAAGRLEIALGLYRGELLSDFYVSASSEFERWLDGERGRLRAAAVRSCLELASTAEGRHRPGAAAEWVRRARVADPVDESLIRRLMEILESAGDAAGSVAAFHEYAGFLAREYELEPSPATMAAFERAHARCVSAARSGGETRLRNSHSPEPPTSSAGGSDRPQRTVPARVAILPLQDLAADGTDGGWFSDGVTEEIITQLSRLTSLRVISRTSVMRYRDRRALTSRQIARELDVDVLLEGTVRQSHGRVRINAQLVDAESNEQLWAQSYDRVLTDIFAIQSDVALKIVAALRAELSASDQERLSRRPTVSLDAWQLYLQGRHRLFRITENGIRDAVDLFGRAILEDPKFALAYSDLALAYGILGMGHGAGDLSPGEAFQRGKRAASRALELDPTLGQAHSRSGFLRFVADHDWAGAERDCRTGVELAPGDALAHDIHGLLLSSLGRYEEAIAAQRHAQELDPLAPVVSSDLATALLRAGRYDEALAEARRLISFEPDFPLGHSTLGWALIRKGLTDEGLIELRRATRLSPGNTLFVAQLGQAYGEVGRLDEAKAILRRLEGRSRRRYVSPYHLAYVHTGMGDQERAMDCLERAYQQRAGGLYGVNGSFLFRSLKPHPRYQALMVAMKLDQPPAARQGDGAGAVVR